MILLGSGFFFAIKTIGYSGKVYLLLQKRETSVCHSNYRLDFKKDEGAPRALVPAAMFLEMACETVARHLGAANVPIVLDDSQGIA